MVTKQFVPRYIPGPTLSHDLIRQRPAIIASAIAQATYGTARVWPSGASKSEQPSGTSRLEREFKTGLAWGLGS